MPDISGTMKRHGNTTLPWRTLLLSGFASLLFILFGAAPETLVYSRETIQQGEWWRLITGHWVHSDSGHALWDISALLLLGWFYETHTRQSLLRLLVPSSLFISAAIWFLLPELDYYCGLSGILHSLLVITFYQHWRQHQQIEYLAVIVFTVIKIVIEMNLSTALFTNTAWPALPESHLYGVIFAAIYVLAENKSTSLNQCNCK